MGIQINGQTDTITAIDGQMTISGTDLSTNSISLSTINATGVSTFAGNIDANGDLDVDGHTELDAVNVSGFLTATSAYYSGDVTVLGTLTYEDVTNVDVVGIATARAGLRINGGGLYVTGVSTFNGDLSITDKIVHEGDTDTAIRFPANDTITAETGGSERLRITSSGNIGIGTDNPTSKLHVNGGVLVKGPATPNINFSPLSGSSGNADISFDGNDLRIVSNSSSADVRINAYSRDNDFVLKQDGKIGIGTDNPISELMVENATQSHITVKTSGSNMAKFGSKGNDVYVGGTAGAANIIFKRNIISIDHPADSGTETLRIDDEGNVNIGAKDYHNHGNTVDSLQIGYATNLYEDSYTSGTDNYSIWANNAYYDGSNNFYMRNDEASRIYQNAGNFYFDNAPSGTADTAITFTTRLRITPSGQVAINGGSPNANWGPFNVNIDGSNIMHLGYGANYDNYFTAGGSGTQIFRAGGTERFRIGAGGQIGLGGANYGTSGQVLTSQGSSAAPQWATSSSEVFAFASFDANQSLTPGSKNVSSVTNNATGKNTVNYTTSHGSTNYSVLCSGARFNAGSDSTSVSYGNIANGSVQIHTGGPSGTYLNFADTSVCVLT